MRVILKCKVSYSEKHISYKEHFNLAIRYVFEVIVAIWRTHICNGC